MRFSSNYSFTSAPLSSLPAIGSVELFLQSPEPGTNFLATFTEALHTENKALKFLWKLR